VSNYITLLEEDFGNELSDGARQYLSVIEGASARMSVLVKALLNFSRLGRDKRLVKSSCEQLIRDVMEDMRTTIQESDARIDIEEMPHLFVYEAEMRQLFQNLISNAIKFQSPGIKPNIRISAAHVDDKWRFSVSDNGIGINPLHHGRIFNIFQRLHTTDEYEGHGIGLANCKKIAEIHQGEIWVDSREGQGSTFYFTIGELTDGKEA
jgi:light-regulated signal transduction histidine kinase (bacteriophytochrome)